MGREPASSDPAADGEELRPEHATATSGTASARAIAAASPLRAALDPGLRMLGVICTPKLPQHPADLPDGGACAQRLPHRREEIRVALGDLPHLGEPRSHGLCIASRAYGRSALALAALALRVDLEELDALGLVLHEAVDADDDPLSRLDLGLVAERRSLDLGLDEALLDCRDRAAELVHAVDELLRALLELRGQRLDVVRAAERVGGVGRPRLVRQDLLGSQGDACRVLRRERERLVERVRVDRLRSAAYGRERLNRDPHDVRLRLLGRERGAAGLRVEAQRGRARVRRAEAVSHDARPETTGRTELGDLLEEVVVRVEEEREALAEAVRREPGRDRRLAVRDAVRERERELLGRARARLADVVAGDRDRVPARQPLLAVREEIGREPHGGPRREDVVAASDVLLENVVLDCSTQLLAGDALTLRDELVQE